MLPDIIDKPLGLIAFGSPNMGRTFAHTLLFLLLLAALSFYTRDIRLISLSWGVLIHLVLDYMWNSPVTLLWPLLGIFPEAARLDTLSYLEVIFSGLRDPGILIPELLGLSYLIYFAYMRRGQISAGDKCSWNGREKEPKLSFRRSLEECEKGFSILLSQFPAELIWINRTQIRYIYMEKTI